MKTDFGYKEERYRDEVEKSINFAGQTLDFYTEAKTCWILDITSRRFGGTNQLKVLDIGCGAGLTDGYLVNYFGSLHGVDIDSSAIDTATSTNPSAHYQVYDGDSLPFDDGSFDVAFAINVLHHVPPENWAHFMDETRRVLREGGLALVFEHNPLNPLTRRVVSQCSFDEDAVLLTRSKVHQLFCNAGLVPVEQRYILFFPLKSQITSAIERKLGWLPLGAQHYVAAVKQC